ncbi:MAG: TonB-dependent receptor plug domain-containing protein [Moraxella sp.]|nr:TonB-dependent receptor plug domain-containing protein [Moraxella sp.]
MYANETADTYHVTLNTLEATVTNPFSQQVGTQKLTTDDIKNRPTGNGNITELLKHNPTVRYSNNADTSTSAGEIKPNEISIHGEKFYHNNFVLNGMSNNDNIHPYGDSANNAQGQNPYELPSGGTQTFWVDTHLLKNVEVFDSNISAKYGQFTGGVINAELIDPDTKSPSGRVFYRTSRDDWAKYHLSESDQSDFENAYNNLQPKFTKHQYGVSVNQPINAKSAVLFSYNATTSDIPFNHTQLRHASEDTWLVNQGGVQERKNETFLLRGIYHADNGDTIKATAMYSPHESLRFKNNVKNGMFTITGGGYNANIEWDKDLSWAKASSYLGYKNVINEIDHQENDYHIYRRNANSSVVTWRDNSATAKFGGYGTYSNEKDIITAKQDFKVPTYKIGNTDNNLIFGWQIDHATAKYSRDTQSNLYTYTNNTSVVCHGDSTCVDGEQYASRKTVYDIRNAKVSDHTYAMYLENTSKFNNLDLSVGLRTDHNSLLKNTNLAPRLSATWDVFGDERTRVFGGANRYYGNSILAYALRQGIGNNEIYTRSVSGGVLGDWTLSSTGVGGSRHYSLSDLKTPYSDELNVGIAQKWLGALWTAKWVRRDGKDQFTGKRADQAVSGVRDWWLVNDGTSKNQNVSLSVQPIAPMGFEYADVNWQLNWSWQKSKSNNTHYDTLTTDLVDTADMVYYDGKIMDYSELPLSDFNTPWKAGLSINTFFPKHHITWVQDLNYTAGHRYLTSKSSDEFTCAGDARCDDWDGIVVRPYSEDKQSGYFTMDWRFNYEKPLNNGHSLGVNVDVNNVLNKVIVSSQTSSNNTYKLGRNFWLGVNYNW